MPELSEQKAYTSSGIELKAVGDAEGSFAATFATMGVIDHHGDVTLPGAFENGKSVLIGAYQHNLMAAPIGKGVIRADEERAWVEGEFWLNTSQGQNAYQTIKNAGDLQEWSYVFTVEQSDFGPFETDKGNVDVRFLKKLDVWSIDPVLRGAGIGTRTEQIKSADGYAFIDHAAGIADAVDDFLTRAKGRLDFRAKSGRQLSQANVDRLSSIAESLRNAAVALDQLLTDATPQKSWGIELEREHMRFQEILARANGLLAD